MSNIHVEIIAPTGIIYKGDCQMVRVPSADGEMGLMHGHEIVAATLKEGQVVIIDDHNNAKETFDVKGGFVEVKDETNVLVLVD